MAVKSILGNKNWTYEDLFDTQDALDEGKKSHVGYLETVQKIDKNFWTGYSNPRLETRVATANSGNLGSVLGLSNEIGAYKKRKQEQQGAAQQGIGRSQSILGGTVI